MDLLPVGICIVGAIVCGFVVYVTSVYGTKEKTYEEAIAEQRKMPNASLLIGRNKEKMKNKKGQKKPLKKVKEKRKESIEVETVKEPEKENDAPSHSNEELHVNFVEPEAAVIESPVVVPDVDKKKKKKDKVKPILLNKREPANIAEALDVLPANHFEELKPKDDLMLRKTSKSDLNEKQVEVLEKVKIENEDVEPLEKPKEKKVKDKEEDKGEKKKEKNQQQQNRSSKVDLMTTDAIVPLPAETSPKLVPIKSPKESKKKSKKNDVPSISQFAPDTVDFQLFVNLIRQASLTRDEVQNLTDLLLNKQLDDKLDPAEWVEGRQDPVVKMKKQLAEREEALENEKASSVALQNKLKELRSELNKEKTKQQQAYRQYEESINTKQAELQSLHQRLNTFSIQYEADKQGIVQMQNKIKEDQMVVRKLQEDMAQAQSLYQQELQQRKQLEKHLQERENAYKAQIHQTMVERDQSNVSYNSELQKSRHLEEEIMQLQGKIKGLVENSSRQHEELARQLEEVSRINQDLEKKLGESRHNLDGLQLENNRLQQELHTVTNKMTTVLQADWEKRTKLAEQRVSELDGKSSGLEKDLQKLKARVSDLQTDLDKAHSERDRLHNEHNQLLKEVEELRAAEKKILDTTERSPAVGHENGGSPQLNLNSDFINHEASPKGKNTVAEELREQLLDKEGIIERLTSEIQSGKSTLSQVMAEFDKQKTELSALKAELDSQKAKNDELRQKNWKTVEALQIAEKALDAKVKESENTLKSKTTEAHAEQQRITQEFLARLFPKIEINEKNYSKWLDAFETKAKTELSSLALVSAASSSSSEKIAEQEKLIKHYKSIIDETEGMLSKLQQHVEQEEIRWREKLATKQAEIEEILKNHNSEESSQISNLEAHLETIKAEIEVIRAQSAEYSEKYTQKCNEIESISNKLSAEIDKTKELNKEIVKLRSNLKIGQDSFEAEKKARLELEEKLKVLSCNSVANANENAVPVTLPRSSDLISSNESHVQMKKKNKKRKKPTPRKAARSKSLREWFRRLSGVRTSSRSSSLPR